MKRMIWITLAIFLVILPMALGTGVGPADVREYFEPGLEKTINLQVYNPEHKNLRVTVYAKGELSDYITFPVQSFDMSSDETERVLSYTIKLPMSIEAKGNLETKIIVLAIPEQKNGQITANTELVSTLTLTVPYGDKYAEADLFVPQMRQGVSSNIVVDIYNHGQKEIQDTVAVIDIYDLLNKKIAVLRSDSMYLEKKEKRTVVIPYTPELANGLYKARLTLIYDGKNYMEDEVFSVGSPEIIVDLITVESFQLGGIAKFDILLESQWNQKIHEVYGVVSVQDNKDKVYTTYKSATTDIEAFGKQTLEAYWDTDAVGTGRYNLNVDLYYLDQTSSYVQEIEVTPSKINLGPTGKVIEGGSGNEVTGINVQAMLAVIIILLIVLIVGVFVGVKKIMNKK